MCLQPRVLHAMLETLARETTSNTWLHSLLIPVHLHKCHCGSHTHHSTCKGYCKIPLFWKTSLVSADSAEVGRHHYPLSTGGEVRVQKRPSLWPRRWPEGSWEGNQCLQIPRLLNLQGENSLQGKHEIYRLKLQCWQKMPSL